MAHPRSYFQLLPLDVLIKLVNEVRHPTAGYRVDEHATARRILVLLKGPDSLREAARNVFDAVSTLPVTGKAGSCIRAQSGEILAEILRCLGDCTRSVRLQCRRGDGEWLISTLRYHARHVTHLELHGVLARCFLDDVLTVVPRLESLVVHCRNGLNGRHLHSLVKYASRVTSLELYGLSGSYSFANFWPNFPDLTHLALTVDRNNIHPNSDDAQAENCVFDGMENACRQLASLNVRKLEASGLRNVARLCATLSRYRNLRSLSLDLKHIPENTVLEQLEIIKNSLSDTARVSVSCTSAQFIPSLSVLGSSLVEIRPKTVFNHAPAGLRHCASLCTRLEKVCLQLNDSCYAEFIAHLLDGVGPTLKDINLTAFPSHSHYHPVPVALDVVAEKSGNLEYFEYHPLESAQGLKAIARRNPWLKRVRVSPLHSGLIGIPEKWILDTVASLAEWCHQLEEINILAFADSKAGETPRITGLDRLLASRTTTTAHRSLRVQVGDVIYCK